MKCLARVCQGLAASVESRRISALLLHCCPARLVESWGPAILRLTYGYGRAVAAAWPIFMFLFGFYFPEPLPFFTRPGSWRKWVPCIVIVPYAICTLGFVAISVGDLTNYSSVEPLYRALHPIRGAIRLYQYCLVGAFFGLIFTKAAITRIASTLMINGRLGWLFRGLAAVRITKTTSV